MPLTKEQLRAQTLLDRNMTRTKDPVTGRFTIQDNTVDKTSLMLYTEGVTGMRIEDILLKQMSTRRLAEWLSRQIHKPISHVTIINWRKQFKMYRMRNPRNERV